MAKKNKKYISIGTLSKLTGVHIKSLRYYDEIGILRPAYVDPNTRYRYYDQRQMVLVDSIQMCVELDIPLKKLPAFLSEDKKEINLYKLLKYGSRIADEKILAIKEKQSTLVDFKKELERTDTLTDVPKFYNMLDKLCWLEPNIKGVSIENLTNAITKIIDKIEMANMQVGYEWGLLGVWQNGQYNEFIFSDVIGAYSSSESIIYIPPIRCLCKKSTNEQISSAPNIFGKMFTDKDTVIAIETQSYTWNFDYYNPSFELRCGKCPKLDLPKI